MPRGKRAARWGKMGLAGGRIIRRRAAHAMPEVKNMQNFEEYTPEMMVYYNALNPRLQNELRASELPVEDLESLAAAAELLAQSGQAGELPE